MLIILVAKIHCISQKQTFMCSSFHPWFYCLKWVGVRRLLDGLKQEKKVNANNELKWRVCVIPVMEGLADSHDFTLRLLVPFISVGILAPECGVMSWHCTLYSNSHAKCKEQSGFTTISLFQIMKNGKFKQHCMSLFLGMNLYQSNRLHFQWNY